MKGLIETWGKGTNKILRLCQEHGIPEPIFEEYSGGVSVQFMFAEPIQRIGTTTLQQKISVKSLSKIQQGILQALEQFGELKSAEILVKLENPPPARTYVII